MKATIEQLKKIESLKKDFCLDEVKDYGFYSDGTIGVLCVDKFGMFSVKIEKNGDFRTYKK